MNVLNIYFQYIIYLTNINIRWYIYISSGVKQSAHNHHATSKSKSDIFSRKINKIRME